MFFRFRIKCRGRFIEEKNRCVFQQRARDRQALLLSTGKHATFITDYRLVAIWLGDNEVMREGGAGRGVNLFRSSVEPSELDVVEDGVVKQKCVLRHKTNLLP